MKDAVFTPREAFIDWYLALEHYVACYHNWGKNAAMTEFSLGKVEIREEIFLRTRPNPTHVKMVKRFWGVSYWPYPNATKETPNNPKKKTVKEWDEFGRKFQEKYIKKES